MLQPIFAPPQPLGITASPTFAGLTLAGALSVVAGAVENLLSNNWSNNNVFAIQNLNISGYSALRILTYLSKEVFALGYGNPTSAVSNTQGKVFFEISDATDGLTCPDFVWNQTTDYSGGTFGIWRRFLLSGSTGAIQFFRRGVGTPANSDVLLHLDGQTAKLGIGTHDPLYAVHAMGSITAEPTSLPGLLVKGTPTVGLNFDTSAAIGNIIQVQSTNVLTRPGGGSTLALAAAAFWQRFDFYANNVIQMSVIATGITIAAGKVLTLGNSAVTGLVAGAFAATTDATLLFTDNAGQAYRVPAKI